MEFIQSLRRLDVFLLLLGNEDSVYVDIRFFNDRSPFSHLEAQKRGKLVRRGADYYGTALFEFVSDHWRCEGRNGCAVGAVQVFREPKAFRGAARENGWRLPWRSHPADGQDDITLGEADKAIGAKTRSRR